MPETEDGLKKFYDNLIGSGKLSEKQLQPYPTFRENIQDPAKAQKFYSNLVNKKVFTEKQLGGSYDGFAQKINGYIGEPIENKVPDIPNTPESAPEMGLKEGLKGAVNTFLPGAADFVPSLADNFVNASKGSGQAIAMGIEDQSLKLSQAMSGEGDNAWNNYWKDQEKRIQGNISDLKQWKDDIPEPTDDAAGFIGGMLPFAATVAAAVVTKNPYLATGLTGAFGEMGYGEGIQAYDEYKDESKEPVNPVMRTGAGLGYALAYTLPLTNYVGKAMPKGVVNKVLGKTIAQSPKATEMGAKIFEKFAKANPPMAKKLAIELGKSATHGVATMEAISLSKMAVDNFVIGRNITSDEFIDTVWGSAKSGVAFGLMTGPFSMYAQSKANTTRRKQQGSITLTTDAKGNPIEVLPSRPGEKNKGMTPNGKIVDVTSEQVQNAFTIPTDVFDGAIREYKSTGKAPESLERDAYSGRVMQYGEKIANKDGVITVATHKTGDKVYIVGRNTDGSYTISTKAGEIIRDVPQSDLVDVKNTHISDFHKTMMAEFDGELGKKPPVTDPALLNGIDPNIITKIKTLLKSEKSQKEIEDELGAFIENDPTITPEQTSSIFTYISQKTTEKAYRSNKEAKDQQVIGQQVAQTVEGRIQQIKHEDSDNVIAIQDKLGDTYFVKKGEVTFDPESGIAAGSEQPIVEGLDGKRKMISPKDVSFVDNRTTDEVAQEMIQRGVAAGEQARQATIEPTEDDILVNNGQEFSIDGKQAVVEMDLGQVEGEKEAMWSYSIDGKIQEPVPESVLVRMINESVDAQNKKLAEQTVQQTDSDTPTGAVSEEGGALPKTKDNETDWDALISQPELFVQEFAKEFGVEEAVSELTNVKTNLEKEITALNKKIDKSTSINAKIKIRKQVAELNQKLTDINNALPKEGVDDTVNPSNENTDSTKPETPAVQGEQNTKQGDKGGVELESKPDQELVTETKVPTLTEEQAAKQGLDKREIPTKTTFSSEQQTETPPTEPQAEETVGETNEPVKEVRREEEIVPDDVIELNRLTQLVEKSPSKNIPNYLNDALHSWNYLIKPTEKITARELSRRIKESHSLSNPKTALDYSLFWHLNDQMFGYTPKKQNEDNTNSQQTPENNTSSQEVNENQDLPKEKSTSEITFKAPNGETYTGTITERFETGAFRVKTDDGTWTVKPEQVINAESGGSADKKNKIQSWTDAWEKTKEANDVKELDKFYNKVKVALNGYAQGKDVVKEFEALKQDIEQYAEEWKKTNTQTGTKTTEPIQSTTDNVKETGESIQSEPTTEESKGVEKQPIGLSDQQINNYDEAEKFVNELINDFKGLVEIKKSKTKDADEETDALMVKVKTNSDNRAKTGKAWSLGDMFFYDNAKDVEGFYTDPLSRSRKHNMAEETRRNLVNEVISNLDPYLSMLHGYSIDNVESLLNKYELDQSNQLYKEIFDKARAKVEFAKSRKPQPTNLVDFLESVPEKKESYPHPVLNKLVKAYDEAKTESEKIRLIDDFGYSLSGKHNQSTRVSIISALKGEKVSASNSGINALKEEIYKWLDSKPKPENKKSKAQLKKEADEKAEKERRSKPIKIWDEVHRYNNNVWVVKTTDDQGKITLHVIDKENKPVSRSLESKALTDLRKKGDFDYGDTYMQTVEKEGVELTSDDNLIEVIVEYSNNPSEVLSEIAKVPRYIPEELLDPKELAIRGQIGKITSSSWNRFGDRNIISKDGPESQIPRFYFSSKGEGIDQVAKHATEKFGSEITTQNVVDFILRYPYGSNTIETQPNPDYLDLVDKFTQLTGLMPTSMLVDRYAKHIAGNEAHIQNKEDAKGVANVIPDEEISDEDFFKLTDDETDNTIKNTNFDTNEENQDDRGTVGLPGSENNGGINQNETPIQGRGAGDLQQDSRENKELTREEKIKSLEDELRLKNKELGKAERVHQRLKNKLEKDPRFGGKNQIDLEGNVKGGLVLDLGDGGLKQMVLDAKKEVDKLRAETNEIQTNLNELKKILPGELDMLGGLFGETPEVEKPVEPKKPTYLQDVSDDKLPEWAKEAVKVLDKQINILEKAKNTDVEFVRNIRKELYLDPVKAIKQIEQNINAMDAHTGYQHMDILREVRLIIDGYKFLLPDELNKAEFRNTLKKMYTKVDNDPQGNSNIDDEIFYISTTAKSKGYQGQWGKDGNGNERMFFTKVEQKELPKKGDTVVVTLGGRKVRLPDDTYTLQPNGSIIFDHFGMKTAKVGEYTIEKKPPTIRAAVSKKPSSDKTLIVQHNIQPDHILATDEFGGIPVPSLAITDKDVPFSGYGAITLVGDVSMVDPKVYGNETYDADAYSPTMPYRMYRIKNNELDKFQSELNKSVKGDKKLIGEMSSSIYQLEQNLERNSPESFANNNKNDRGLKLAFLLIKGIPVKAKYVYNRIVTHNWGYTPTDEDLSFVKANKSSFKDRYLLSSDKFKDTKEYEAVKKWVNEVHLPGIIELYSSIDDAEYGKELADSVKEKLFSDNGELHWGTAERIYEGLYGLQNETSKRINSSELEKSIEKKFTKKLQAEYEQWLIDKARAIHGGEYFESGNKKLAYTPENVIEYMTGKTRGRESTMVHGLGKARAKMAYKYRSVEQIKADKGRLVTKQEMEDFQEEIQNRFFKLKDSISRYYKWDSTWDALDDLSKAFADYATSKNVSSALRKNDYIDVPSEYKDEFLEIYNMLKEAPTQYFESKPQRIVKLNEFTGAVVPKGTSSEVVKKLRDNGITVKYYDNSNYEKSDEARRKAVDELSERKDIRFSLTGEKGASNLDQAEEATTRMDNLNVAREMEGGKSIEAARLQSFNEIPEELKKDARIVNRGEDKDGESMKRIQANPQAKAAWADYIRAQEHEKEWASLSEKEQTKRIKLATGWERGADKKWRYEIADYITSVSDYYEFANKKKGVVETEANVLVSRELNKAYPQLKTIDVKINISPESKDKGAFQKFDVDGKKTYGFITIDATDFENAQSILLHEVQHAIQDIEGFAKGGNFNSAGEYLIEQNQKTLDNLNKQIIDLGKKRTEGNLTEQERKENISAHKLLVSVRDEVEDKIEEIKKNKAPKFKAYQRLAGEVESRNVQSRMNMTPEERRNSLISETQDVATEDQIFLKEAFGAQFSEATRPPEPTNIAQALTDDYVQKVHAFEKKAREEAQRVADNLGVEINIVSSEDEIPQKYFGSINAKDFSGRLGAFFSPETGEIYVILGNIGSLQDVRRNVLHEAVGHKGLRLVFGREYNRMLDQIYSQMTPEEIKEIEDMGYDGTDTREIADEFLAYKAPNAKKPNFIQRAIAKIREWIRRLVGLKYSDNDLNNLFDLSRKALRKPDPDPTPTKKFDNVWDFLNEGVTASVNKSKKPLYLPYEEKSDISESSGYYKQNRKSSGEVSDYETWQKKQLPKYAQQVEEITSRSFDQKKYLSDEELADLQFMVSRLSKAKYDFIDYKAIDRSYVILARFGKIKLNKNTIEYLKDEGYNVSENQADYETSSSTNNSNNGKQPVNQTKTKAFKEWFGESKVVDERGEPLVVYHGTGGDFDTFDIERSDLGSHFGTIEQAESLTGKGSILPVYLSIKNPLRVQDLGAFNFERLSKQLIEKGITTKEILDSFVKDWTKSIKYGEKIVRDALNNKGYDGIVYLNREEGIKDKSILPWEYDKLTDNEFLKHHPEAKDSYIAFSPTQIKSATGNNGNFDKNNPSIRAALKPVQESIEQAKNIEDYLNKQTTQSEENARRIAIANSYNAINTKINKLVADEKTSKAIAKATINAVQTEVANYAKKHMPLDEAGKRDIGKLLTMVKNTTTPSRLSTIFRQIDDITTGINKRKIINRVDHILKVNKPKKVNNKLQGRLDPDVYYTLGKIKEIRSLKGEEEINKFADNLDPNDVESIALFTMFSNLEEHSADHINNSLNALNEMVTEGKVWYKEKMEARKKETSELRNRVVSTMTGGKGLTPGIEYKGEEKPAKDWWLKNFINKNQSFEWLMDIISQDKTEKTGQGWMQDHFGDMLNKATNAETKGVREMTEMLNEKASEIFGAKGHKLSRILSNNSKQEKNTGVTYLNNAGKRIEITLSQNEAYKLWQDYQDQRYAASFEKMGIDGVTIDQLERFIRPDVMMWAKWQLENFYVDYYDGVNEKFRENYFVDLAKSNNYSPKKVEVSEAADNDDPMLKQSKVLGSVINGSLKSTVSHANRLSIVDGDMILATHIAQMEHFKAWVEPVRKLRAVFGSRGVQHVLKYQYGNTLRGIINSQINDFARGGTDRALVVTMLDKVRRNFVTAELGLNYSIFPKQLVSSFTYMADIPMTDYFAGILEFAYNPAKIIKTLNESELLKNRYRSGWTHEVESALKTVTPDKLAGTKSNLQQVINMLMLPTRLGDRFAIIAGWSAYKYHYDQKKQSGASEQEAKDFAMNKFERIASRSQQSAALKDTSEIQKGSIGKLFTMFHNSQQQYFRYEIAALRNLAKGRGSKAHNLKILAVTHFILPVLFQYIANYFTDDDDDIENKRLLIAAILGSWNGLLIAGDMIEFGLEKLMGEWWGYSPSPLIGSVENMGRGIAKVAKGVDEVDVDAVIKGSDLIAHSLSQTVLGIPYRPGKKLISEIQSMPDKIDRIQNPDRKKSFDNYATYEKVTDEATKYIKRMKSLKKAMNEKPEEDTRVLGPVYEKAAEIVKSNAKKAYDKEFDQAKYNKLEDIVSKSKRVDDLEEEKDEAIRIKNKKLADEKQRLIDNNVEYIIKLYNR